MRYLVIFSLILILVLSACNNTGTSYTQENIDNFAKCLTENDVVMYGAFWCPHCARTKKRFGNSFQYINYVECDPRGENEQSELCLEKEIEEYDTWEFADGSTLVGEPNFEDMAAKSGCSLGE